MKEIKGNILDVKEGIILHQTNMLGIAGGGLAFQIRNKWPAWFRAYKEDCEYGMKLGEVSYFHIDNKLTICNLFCQHEIGDKATQEDSYDDALTQVKILAAAFGAVQIYVPYCIGCGLGGGNWPTILQKLEKYIPEAIIVKYEN